MPGSLGCGLPSLPWPQLQPSKGCRNPEEETGRATTIPGAGAAQRDPVFSASAGARAMPLPIFGKSRRQLQQQAMTAACSTLGVLVLAHRGGSLGGRISALLLLSLPLDCPVLTQIHYSIANP